MSDDGRWNPDPVEPEFVRVDISGPPPDPIPSRIDQDAWDSDDDMGDEPDGDPMVDYLVLTGADPTEARSKVYSILGKRPTTFMEVYGRGAINETANKAHRNLDRKGIGALDLRTTKASGEPWNFKLRSDRREARELIDQRQPAWLIGSPPCTYFSIPQSSTGPRTGTGQGGHHFDRETEKAIKHVEFWCARYKYKIQHGMHVLHGQPWTARSWKLPRVTELLNHPAVNIARGHMYQFRTMSHGKHREGTRAWSRSPQDL